MGFEGATLNAAGRLNEFPQRHLLGQGFDLIGSCLA